MMVLRVWKWKCREMRGQDKAPAMPLMVAVTGWMGLVNGVQKVWVSTGLTYWRVERWGRCSCVTLSGRIGSPSHSLLPKSRGYKG